MPIIAIGMTKRITFRGALQEFHNTYHYDCLNLPDQSQAAQLVADLTVTEKKLHSTSVTFVRGRLWSAGGSVVANQMLYEVDLSGTGNLTSVGSVDPERCFLIRWPAGKDIRGRPVYLRKYYHNYGGYPGGTSIPDDVLGQRVQIASAMRTSIANIADEALGLPGTTSDFKLCAKNGRLTQGGAECHPWYEHHQLGDQWRG